MKVADIELPDDLYRKALRLSKQNGLSLTDLLCQGLETVVTTQPAQRKTTARWHPPKPQKLGIRTDAPVEDWRLLANEANLEDVIGLRRVKK